jgi:hypothetical protein
LWVGHDAPELMPGNSAGEVRRSSKSSEPRAGPGRSWRGTIRLPGSPRVEVDEGRKTFVV